MAMGLAHVFLALLPCALWACSNEETPAPNGPSMPGDSAAARTTPGAEAPITVQSRDALALSLGLEPRRALAGLAGFQSQSRLTFESAPDRVHELSVICLFPGRARFAMTLEANGVGHRILLYRAGQRGFALEDGAAASREVTGDEFAQWQLQTELRLALFLWPEGPSWTGTGQERRADLTGLGHFVAQLGPDGWPWSVSSFDGEGTEVERLTEVQWNRSGPRPFPSKFALLARGMRVWNEEVVSVETALDYIDLFFFPPDRRASATSTEAPPSTPSDSAASPRAPVPAVTLVPIDWRAAWELRVPFETPLARMSDARERSRVEQARWRERGVETGAEAILELDRAGAAVACLLRAEVLAPGGEGLPEGWTARGETPAWSSPLAEGEPPTAQKIAATLVAADLDPAASLVLARYGPGGDGLVLLGRAR